MASIPLSMSRLIAALGGVGYTPKLPGTAGSIIAALLAWPLWLAGGAVAVFISAGVAFAVGWWACVRVLGDNPRQDPGWIVIDEVAGQWLTVTLASMLLPATPLPLILLLGFVSFRFFDMVKPWPICWFDKTVKGGLGIMLDDIVAALPAAAVTAIILRTVL